jgi:poly(A) polymerase Pap1/uncharacterized protein (UPF0248 family)/endonuclease/exonuclease/phosphatase family metal-dependent hydrolase
MATPIGLSSSTKTALALVAPDHLCSEIDGIRSIHDKAFGKWDAHINILYPFVPLDQLDTTISELRKALLDESRGSLKIILDDVGVFKHRKNATVFFKPSSASEDAIGQMRDNLITCLTSTKLFEHSSGLEFNPHLTVGQASLQHSQELFTLDEEARKVLPMDWEATHLVVLRRNPSGEMIPVERIPFGNPRSETATKPTHTTPVARTVESSLRGWKCCYQLDSSLNWVSVHDQVQITKAPSTCLIASLNLMVEDYAPEFEHRLLSIEQYVGQILDPTKPTILCLQEVNREMLSLIYATPFFQRHFPYSSHTPNSPMQSLRNQVIMSTLSFRTFSLQYAQPHKSSLIAKFLDRDLTVVDVHLTSALTDQAVTIKREQIERLTEVLARHDLLHESVLAGDFNVTTSSQTIHTALEKEIIHSETVHNLERVIDTSRWCDAFIEFQPEDEEDDDIFPGEEGATFDRINNPLAAMGKAPIDYRPQRFDRILFTRDGSIELEEYGRFAIPKSPDEAISDHYGIYTVVSIGSKKPSSSAMCKLNSDLQSLKVEELKAVEDSTDIEQYVSDFMPSAEDHAQRQEALELLQHALSVDDNSRNFIIAPLGSYALDTYFKDSDIDVLVIGAVSPRQFFDTLRTCFNKAGFSAEASSVHLVNSLVQIAEAAVNGIKIDVQYCEAKELLNRYNSPEYDMALQALVFDEKAISELKPDSLRPLNTYRDTAFLLESISDLDSFRLAHRFLSLYLRRRGLYSAKFGYLGGIHLSLMLNRVVKLLEFNLPSSNGLTASRRAFSAATLVRTFFTYYSAFPFASQAVSDPTKDALHAVLKRQERMPLLIPALFTPSARPNVASSATSLSVQTIQSSFVAARNALEEGRWKWCLRPEQESVSDFLNEHDLFVRVQLQVWDAALLTGEAIREVVGIVESRLVSILVGMGKIMGVRARIWPGGFMEESQTREDGDLSGYYLLGVTVRDDEDKIDADRMGLVQGKMISLARQYERIVQQNKMVNGKSVMVSVTTEPKKEIWDMGLLTDPRNWSSFGKATQSLRKNSQEEQARTPAAQSGSSHLGEALPPTAGGEGNRKLRPIQDIISRLKWDEAFDVNDYVVGYEDRFTGVMEMDLVNWKTEATDLEFIPMHRIVWIQNRDGKKVWDRRLRYDSLFQSGIKR